MILWHLGKSLTGDLFSEDKSFVSLGETTSEAPVPASGSGIYALCGSAGVKHVDTPSVAAPDDPPAASPPASSTNGIPGAAALGVNRETSPPKANAGDDALTDLVNTVDPPSQ